MPYFITDESPECNGWATIKEDGEVIGCHDSKDDAIDQMIAVSIAEGLEPGGERKKLKAGKYKMRALPDNYRPALSEDVPEGRACGNCFFYNEEMVNEDRTKAWCENWKEFVDGGFYCNAWKMDEENRAPVAGADKFTTEKEALDRAKQIGCEGTHSMDENGQTIFMPCSTHAAYDKIMGGNSYAEDRQEAEPAPAKDKIVGSDKNKPGSAKGAGGSIKLSEATETGLRNKVSEHNEDMKKEDRPNWTRATYGMLAAVYRRGSGAYSTSHRPGVSRGAWSMARVNAFLHLLRTGTPKNPKYVTDNDLLPQDHPRSTRSMEDRQVDLELPKYIRDAAAKGLELYAQGLAGDGLVSATVREARGLSRGEVSEDKVVRASAWGARHEPDLDAPQNSNAENDDFPGAGAVAHYLWGINPLNPAPARAWFDRKSEQVQAERSFNSPAFIANMTDRDSSGVDMKQAVEVREVNFSDIEMRQTEDAPSDVPMTFRGYAAVFNSPSEDMGFREVIKPGAFARTLTSKNRIRMFLNHNSDIVLASTRAKTLRLIEDEKGLLVDADLPDTTAGRDLSVLLQRGDVDSMSFGFSVPAKGENWSDDGALRELNQVRLHEVSVVTGWPAYTSTSASVRSFDVLAERTNTNADELAEAITLLENGSELDAARADLLAEVVFKLRQDPPANLLGIKQKHLELLAKGI